MSKSVFQTGMSWRVVEPNRPGIREALRDFDAREIAAMSEHDIDELTQDARANRNRRKIEAMIINANRLIKLGEQHGSSQNYLRPHDGFDETVKDLRKQFKFLGDMGCYLFLYVVGEKVPQYEGCANSPQSKASR